MSSSDCAPVSLTPSLADPEPLPIPVPSSPGTALVFGLGYVGAAYARRLAMQGWSILATARDHDRADQIRAQGFEPVDPSDLQALKQALTRTDAVLVTTPPDDQGCPGYRALNPALIASDAHPKWLGYLSTTGVYGDRAGGWVFEDSELNAASPEGARRVCAEKHYRTLAERLNIPLALFRLPGIYGPGRSALDKILNGSARLVRKPGQVFSRIHQEDLVDGLLASMARPRPLGIYNLCDDNPAGADQVLEHAATLLGHLALPEVSFEDPSVSGPMRRFYLDNKRVSNARAKAELLWHPRHATYQAGLKALLRAHRL